MDINTIFNYLFAGAIAWLNLIQVRLREVPNVIDKKITASNDTIYKRIDRLEDKVDLLLLKFHEKDP